MSKTVIGNQTKIYPQFSLILLLCWIQTVLNLSPKIGNPVNTNFQTG